MLCFLSYFSCAFLHNAAALLLCAELVCVKADPNYANFFSYSYNMYLIVISYIYYLIPLAHKPPQHTRVVLSYT